jgi:hypothetical protein
MARLLLALLENQFEYNGSFLACFCLVRGFSRTVNSPVWSVGAQWALSCLILYFSNFWFGSFVVYCVSDLICRQKMSFICRQKNTGAPIALGIAVVWPGSNHYINFISTEALSFTFMNIYQYLILHKGPFTKDVRAEGGGGGGGWKIRFELSFPLWNWHFDYAVNTRFCFN